MGTWTLKGLGKLSGFRLSEVTGVWGSTFQTSEDHRLSVGFSLHVPTKQNSDSTDNQKSNVKIHGNINASLFI